MHIASRRDDIPGALTRLKPPPNQSGRPRRAPRHGSRVCRTAAGDAAVRSVVTILAAVASPSRRRTVSSTVAATKASLMGSSSCSQNTTSSV